MSCDIQLQCPKKEIIKFYCILLLVKNAAFCKQWNDVTASWYSYNWWVIEKQTECKLVIC